MPWVITAGWVASHEFQLTFIAYTVLIVLKTGTVVNKTTDRKSIIGNRSDSGSMGKY